MFLTRSIAENIAKKWGTPVYVYSEKLLEENLADIMNLPDAFGKTVCYAMKANPSKEILKLFSQKGVKIDASSVFEVRRAMMASIPAKDIHLTTQELDDAAKDLFKEGVRFYASSLHQIEKYVAMGIGEPIGLRINLGIGSGHSEKVKTGGSDSSFGIWYEDVKQARALLQEAKIPITTLHSHIGAGADPQIWADASQKLFEILTDFPDVITLNLGGGYKPGKIEATHQAFEKVKQSFLDFAKVTKRELHLEVEPGTYLVAMAGELLSRVQDTTKTDAFTFLKLDTGMSEIIRPTMYNTQHPIKIFNDSKESRDYVVVGHCCESGDLLSINEDGMTTLPLPQAEIDDLIVIGRAGAYVSAMSAKNYNSFPEAAEVLLKKDGTLKLIRNR